MKPRIRFYVLFAVLLVLTVVSGASAQGPEVAQKRAFEEEEIVFDPERPEVYVAQQNIAQQTRDASGVTGFNPAVIGPQTVTFPTAFEVSAGTNQAILAQRRIRWSEGHKSTVLASWVTQNEDVRYQILDLGEPFSSTHVGVKVAHEGPNIYVWWKDWQKWYWVRSHDNGNSWTPKEVFLEPLPFIPEIGWFQAVVRNGTIHLLVDGYNYVYIDDETTWNWETLPSTGAQTMVVGDDGVPSFFYNIVETHEEWCDPDLPPFILEPVYDRTEAWSFRRTSPGQYTAPTKIADGILSVASDIAPDAIRYASLAFPTIGDCDWPENMTTSIAKSNNGGQTWAQANFPHARVVRGMISFANGRIGVFFNSQYVESAGTWPPTWNAPETVNAAPIWAISAFEGPRSQAMFVSDTNQYYYAQLPECGCGGAQCSWSSVLWSREPKQLRLPPGDVEGTVTRSGSPVNDARVTSSAGIPALLNVTTSVTGTYRFAAYPGNQAITAYKKVNDTWHMDSAQTLVQSCQVSTVNLDLIALLRQVYEPLLSN